MTYKELEMELKDIRSILDQCFSLETALSSTLSDVPSAGHCAIVACILEGMLSCQIVSGIVNDQSHWFNVITIEGVEYQFDLTGDQFGRPAIQISEPYKPLYETLLRIRTMDELQPETLKRCIRFCHKMLKIYLKES